MAGTPDKSGEHKASGGPAPEDPRLAVSRGVDQETAVFSVRDAAGEDPDTGASAPDPDAGDARLRAAVAAWVAGDEGSTGASSVANANGDDGKAAPADAADPDDDAATAAADSATGSTGDADSDADDATSPAADKPSAKAASENDDKADATSDSKPAGKGAAEATGKPTAETDAVNDAKPVATGDGKAGATSAAKADSEPATKDDGESATKGGGKSAASTGAKSTAEDDGKASAKADAQPTAKGEAKTGVTSAAKGDGESAAKGDGRADAKADASVDAKSAARDAGKPAAEGDSEADTKSGAEDDAQPVAAAKADAPEDAKADAEPVAEVDSKSKSDARGDGKSTTKGGGKSAAQGDARGDGEPDAESGAQPAAEANAKPVDKADGKPVDKAESKADAKGSGKPAAEADSTADAKANGKADAKTDGKQAAKTDGKPADKADGKPADKADGKSGAKAAGKGVGKAGDQADRPVDQPTAVFKAVPQPVDQPTTTLKAAGTAKSSKFVPLKGLDEGKAAGKELPPEAEQPTVEPAERTTQQPLPPKPPLDLLAELTNTPPPPETRVRTAVRRVKVWTPLVILLVIVFGVIQAVRPLPTPSLSLTADATYSFDGDKASLPWPDEGQGWMDVQGIGTMDDFGKQTPVPIGSVAKSMTAYIVLKDHPLKAGADGPSINVDATAEKEGGYDADGQNESTLNTVKEGDKISQKDALAAVMIPSANNIARLLARWDAGSEEAFVKKMNATAKKLGMKNTTYTDPSGLKESTVSTAEDQVKLGNELVQIPALTDITKLPTWTDPSGKKWTNYNRLVPYDGAIGIKTGTTTKAGGNLLFAATKDAGGSTVTVVGAILGQHKAPIIDTVNAVSKTAMLAAQDAVTSSTVLKKGDVVGYVDDQLGGHTPVTVTKDVKAVGWAGKTVHLQLADQDGKSVPHTGKAGDTVGVLEVGDGEGGAVEVPVALQKSLTEPGFGAKLTRVG